MGSSKKQTIGYKYYADAHMVFGLGVWDKLLAIKYGDKQCWPEESYAVTPSVTGPATATSGTLALPSGVSAFWPQTSTQGYHGVFTITAGGSWTYTLTKTPQTGVVYKETFTVYPVVSGVSGNSQIQISKPTLYGGDTSEGGIEGLVDVMMGSPTQTRNSYMVGKLGEDCPAFRGVVSMAFRNLYWGNSSYFKTVAAMGQRIMLTDDGAAQWYPEKAAIQSDDGDSGADMNPAHIIREMIVSKRGGMGRPASNIDDANFRAAAEALYAEGFGLSMVWTGETSAEEFTQTVLDVIDARLYVHPKTKLYTLKLIRDDYDTADLVTLGPRQIKSVTGYKRPDADELPNSIVVKYWDRIDLSDSTAQSDDVASIIRSNAVRSTTKDYTDSICKASLAARVAQRDRITSGSPVLAAKLKCNRAAADLMPGDAFIFDWPKLHTEPIVMRVVTTKRGGIVNQSVEIEAIEDVFRLDDSTAIGDLPADFIDPVSVQLAQATTLAVEAPYYELLQRLGAAQVEGLLAATPDAGMALVTAATSTAAKNAIVYTDGEEWRDYTDLTPVGALTADIAQTDTTAAITWSTVPEIGTHMQIGGELMRFGGLSGSLSIIGRGVLDTVPATHYAGATVWPWDAWAVTDEIEHAAGEVVAVQARLRNDSRTGAVSASQTLTFANRAIRPYPPGQYRINSEAYPSETIDGLVLTWAQRNRLTQADTLVDESAATITPEAGTTYAVRVLRTDTGAVLYSQTGITGTTHTVSGVTYDGAIKIELYSLRDGYESWQRCACLATHWRAHPLTTENGEYLTTEGGEVLLME